MLHTAWNSNHKKREAYQLTSLTYIGADGNLKTCPIPKDERLSVHAWGRALGLLGGAGWELVSIQHGNRPSELDSNSLVPGNIIAYLKRTVVSGRAVDEPKLNIELLFGGGPNEMLSFP